MTVTFSLQRCIYSSFRYKLTSLVGQKTKQNRKKKGKKLSSLYIYLRFLDKIHYNLTVNYEPNNKTPSKSFCSVGLQQFSCLYLESRWDQALYGRPSCFYLNHDENRNQASPDSSGLRFVNIIGNYRHRSKLSRFRTVLGYVLARSEFPSALVFFWASSIFRRNQFLAGKVNEDTGDSLFPCPPWFSSFLHKLETHADWDHSSREIGQPASADTSGRGLGGWIPRVRLFAPISSPQSLHDQSRNKTCLLEMVSISTALCTNIMLHIHKGSKVEIKFWFKCLLLT